MGAGLGKPLLEGAPNGLGVGAAEVLPNGAALIIALVPKPDVELADAPPNGLLEGADPVSWEKRQLLPLVQRPSAKNLQGARPSPVWLLILLFGTPKPVLPNPDELGPPEDGAAPNGPGAGAVALNGDEESVDRLGSLLVPCPALAP